MPIFDYVCKKCRHPFEAIVQGSEKPECPSCGSGSLEKQLSVFAVGSRSAAAVREPAGPCGSCGHPAGPGACRMN